MTRLKSKYFFLALIFIVFSLIFICGCTSSSTNLQLSTPAFLNLVEEKNDKTGEIRKYLVTDNNIYASYYVFGICSDESYKDNIEKYIRKESEFCFFDVTNVFNNAKTYYYYVQAIGTENYANSPILFGDAFENKITLDTPSLTYDISVNENNEVTSCILNWNKVKSALSYDVYINNSKFTNISSSLNYLELVSIANSFFSKNEEINIKIKAIAPNSNSFILNSEFSNNIKITEHMHESIPVISLNNTTLSWQKDKFADKFEIQISSGLESTTNSILIDGESTSVNLASVEDLNTSTTINCLALLGEYSIKVRAIGKVTKSEFSNVVYFTKTEKLNSPQIQTSYYDQSTQKLYITINVPTILDKDNITLIPDPKIINIKVKIIDSLGNSFEETISIEKAVINFEPPKSLLEEKGLNISSLNNGIVSCFAQGYQYYESSIISQSNITIK